MGAFLLPCTATEVSLLTVWCLIGATPRGSAVDNCRATPQGRDGLSARQMAVLYKQLLGNLSRKNVVPIRG